MLTFEVSEGGGVRITGSRRDLLDLASWVVEATRRGRVTPAFVADRALSTVEIVCHDEERPAGGRGARAPGS